MRLRALHRQCAQPFPQRKGGHVLADSDELALLRARVVQPLQTISTPLQGKVCKLECRCRAGFNQMCGVALPQAVDRVPLWMRHCRSTSTKALWVVPASMKFVAGTYLAIDLDQAP